MVRPAHPNPKPSLKGRGVRLALLGKQTLPSRGSVCPRVTPQLGATHPTYSAQEGEMGRGLLHLKNEETEVQRASLLGQCHTGLAASTPKPSLILSTHTGSKGCSFSTTS